MAEGQDSPNMSRAEADRLVGKIDGTANIFTQALSGVSAAIGAAYLFATGYVIKLMGGSAKTIKSATENIQKTTGVDGFEAIAAAQAKRRKIPVEKSAAERMTGEERPEFSMSGGELEAENHVADNLKASLTNPEHVISNEIADLPPVKLFDQHGQRLPQEAIDAAVATREEARQALRAQKAQAIKMAEEALGHTAPASKKALHVISPGVLNEAEHAVAEASTASKVFGKGGIKGVLAAPIRVFKELQGPGKALMLATMGTAAVGGYLWQRRANKKIDEKFQPEINQLLTEEYGSSASADKPVIGKHTARLASEVPSVSAARE